MSLPIPKNKFLVAPDAATHDNDTSAEEDGGKHQHHHGTNNNKAAVPIVEEPPVTIIPRRTTTTVVSENLHPHPVLTSSSRTENLPPLVVPGAFAVMPSHTGVPNSHRDEDRGNDDDIALTQQRQHQHQRQRHHHGDAELESTIPQQPQEASLPTTPISDVERIVFAENVQLDDNFVKKHQTLILLAVILSIVIALGTTMVVAFGGTTNNNNDNDNENDNNNNNNNNSNNNIMISNSDSPTLSPTTSQCVFCYGSSDLKETTTTTTSGDTTILLGGVNLKGIVVSQIPFRTCQDIYDTIQDLTIWDKECRINQAEAGWRCGCNTFPPISKTSNCTICPQQGQKPVPPTTSSSSTVSGSSSSSSGSLSICTAASKWLPIVGDGLPPEKCDRLRQKTLNSCICIEDDDQNNDEEEVSTTVEENDGNNTISSSTTTTCIDDLTNIGTMEATQDGTIERTYVLCPNTTFRVNSIVTSGNDWPYVSPIMGRSNLRILCGITGSSSNNCTIRGGKHGVEFLNGWNFPGETTRDNLHIQGIHFSIRIHAIFSRTVSNLTIVDCIFEKSGDVPIMSTPWILGPPPRKIRRLSSTNDAMDIPQQTHNNRLSRRLQTEEELPVEGGEEGGEVMPYIGKITIIDSIFQNNNAKGKPTNDVMDSLIQMAPAVDELAPIPGIPTLMAVHIENCLFDNNIGFNQFVNSLGHGSLTLIHNCFIGNDYTISPVMVEPVGGFGVGPLVEKNYLENIEMNMSSSLQEVCMVRDNSNMRCVSYFDGTSKEDACSSYNYIR